MKKKMRKRCYVDIGSHGGLFYFDGGPIADRYPKLMQVYHKKVSPDLKPAIIEYYV